MKNLLWLGLPWLIEKFGFSKTKVFSVAAAGVAVYCAFAGFDAVSGAILAWLGAGALVSLREAWQRIEPYILMLDKLLEQTVGYKDLDVVAAKLKALLDGVK